MRFKDKKLLGLWSLKRLKFPNVHFFNLTLGEPSLDEDKKSGLILRMNVRLTRVAVIFLKIDGRLRVNADANLNNQK